MKPPVLAAALRWLNGITPHRLFTPARHGDDSPARREGILQRRHRHRRPAGCASRPGMAARESATRPHPPRTHRRRSHRLRARPRSLPVSPRRHLFPQTSPTGKEWCTSPLPKPPRRSSPPQMTSPSPSMNAPRSMHLRPSSTSLGPAYPHRLHRRPSTIARQTQGRSPRAPTRSRGHTTLAMARIRKRAMPCTQPRTRG